MKPLFEMEPVKLPEKVIQQKISYYTEILSKAIKNKVYNNKSSKIYLIKEPLFGTPTELEYERNIQLEKIAKEKLQDVRSEKKRLTKYFKGLPSYIKDDMGGADVKEDLQRIIETTMTLVKKSYNENYKSLEEQGKKYKEEYEKLKEENSKLSFKEREAKIMQEEIIIKNLPKNENSQADVIKKETQDVLEIKETENYHINNEILKYSEMLRGSEFFISENKLNVKTDKGYAGVANFIPIITKKLIFNNGNDKEIRYSIKALLLDNDVQMLDEIEITPQELNTFKFILGSSWDTGAIVEPSSTNYSRLRYVAQLIAKNTMKEQEVYTNTGFKRIGKDLVYLYHNGVIGNKHNISTDLSQDGLERYCFTNKEFDRVQALKRSYSMLDVATHNLTIPLMATIYLAPLTSILQEEGIEPDYILMYVAKTGAGKSSIVAAGLSHFGDFTRNTFPATFENTVSAIEKKAFTLKDTILVTDDLKPSIDMKQQLAVLEKLYGIFGDRSSKSRISPNLKKLRPTYTARGLCIITSEIIPELSEGRLFRSIIVNIKKSDIDLSKLTVIQNNKEELAFAMKLFIKWIIKNETEIRAKAKQMMQNLQSRQDNSIHGRTNESVNTMTIGFTFFLQFMLENEIIDKAEYKKMQDEAYSTLKAITDNQIEELGDITPVAMFYNAIEELLHTNKIYLLDYKTGKPLNDTKGLMVGYLDNEEKEYYFFENTIYSEVCKFYSGKGNKFPISKLSLWKYLREGNLLHRTEKQKRNTVERVNPITKEKMRVIPVKVVEETDV